MGLFDDFSRFLEERLDEFLKSNPHLELQALLEQVREQEQETLKLIRDLEGQKAKLEQEILSIAQDIQNWHNRVNKAKSAGRLDLAQGAQEREAALLRQGNQVWGQMQGAKQQLAQAEELLRQIAQRKKELQEKVAQVKTQPTPSRETWGWNQGVRYGTYNKANDPLEAEFARWELDNELEQLKRNL